jgi:hypothetical protein
MSHYLYISPFIFQVKLSSLLKITIIKIILFNKLSVVYVNPVTFTLICMYMYTLMCAYILFYFYTSLSCTIFIHVYIKSNDTGRSSNLSKDSQLIKINDWIGNNVFNVIMYPSHHYCIIL